MNKHKYDKYKTKYLNLKNMLGGYDCDSHNLGGYVKRPPITFTMGYSNSVLVCKFINNQRNKISDPIINQQYREYVCDNYKALNNNINMHSKYKDLINFLETYIDRLDSDIDKYIDIVTGIFLISLFLDHIKNKGMDYPMYLSPVYEEHVSNYDVLSIIDGMSTLNDVRDNVLAIYDKILYHRQDRFIIVPFVSVSGIFGLNSFLHLYFNNIAPVGISITKSSSAHMNILETKMMATMHDYQHFVNRYLKINEHDMKNYNNIYDSVFENFKKYNYVENYRIIALLFFLINEIGYVPLHNSTEKSNLLKNINDRFQTYYLQDSEQYMTEDELKSTYAVEMSDLIPIIESTLKYGNDVGSDTDITNFRNYGLYVNKHMKDMIELFFRRYPNF